jgi:hypothetical protein
MLNAWQHDLTENSNKGYIKEEWKMATITFDGTTYQVRVGHELSSGGGGPKSRGFLACFGADGHQLVTG